MDNIDIENNETRNSNDDVNNNDEGDKEPIKLEIKEKNKENDFLVQRKYLLKELFDTEEKYINDMDLFFELFLFPIRDQRVLPSETQIILFSNLEILIGINKKLLILLKAECEKEYKDQQVGKLFLQQLSSLKSYSLYCANVPKAQDKAKELENTNNQWRFFLNEAQSSKRTKDLKFDSYLIKPVQRLTRYPLLLKELSKLTPPEHIDHESVKSSVQAISELVNYVNEKKRTFEGVDGLVKVIESISGLPKDFVAFLPSRKLILNGVIKVKSGQSKWNKERKYWLCNDILLLAEKNNSYKDCIYFDKALCNDLPKTSQFEVVHLDKMKKLVFTAKNVEQKEELMLKVKEFIQIFLDNYKKQKIKTQKEENRKSMSQVSEKNRQSIDKMISSPNFYDNHIQKKPETLYTQITKSLDNNDIKKLNELSKDPQFPEEIIRISKSLDVTPLHSATLSKSDELINILLENGAELDLKDKDGNTPLLVATKMKEEKITNLYLEHMKKNFKEKKKSEEILNGCDKNGVSPLLAAMKVGRVLVESMIKQGAHVKEKNPVTQEFIITEVFTMITKEFKTLNLHSVYNSIDILIKHGANINQIDSKGFTPLHSVIITSQSQSEFPTESLLDYLFSKKADINVSTQMEKQTPLHLSVKFNDKNIVEYITEKPDLNMDLTNSDNKTPLEYALSLENTNPKIIELLKNKKSELDDEEEGDTSSDSVREEPKLNIPEVKDEQIDTTESSEEDEKVLGQFKNSLHLIFGVEKSHSIDSEKIFLKSNNSKNKIDSEEDNTDSSDERVLSSVIKKEFVSSSSPLYDKSPQQTKASPYKEIKENKLVLGPTKSYHQNFLQSEDGEDDSTTSTDSDSDSDVSKNLVKMKISFEQKDNNVNNNNLNENKVNNIKDSKKSSDKENVESDNKKPKKKSVPTQIPESKSNKEISDTSSLNSSDPKNPNNLLFETPNNFKSNDIDNGIKVDSSTNGKKSSDSVSPKEKSPKNSENNLSVTPPRKPKKISTNIDLSTIENIDDKVIVKFDYENNMKGYLTVKKGDVIHVLSKSESGWWTGELNGKKGKFPESYASPLSESKRSARKKTSVTDLENNLRKSSTGTTHVISNFPYKAEKKGYLSLQKGDVIRVIQRSDTGWWKGELNGIEGKFPESYTSPHQF